MKDNKILNKNMILYNLIISIIASFPIFFNYVSENTENVVKYKFIFSSPMGIEKSFILFVCIFVSIYTISRRFKSVDKKNKLFSLIGSLFISFCMVLGNSYSLIQSWNYIFGSFNVFIGSVFNFLSYFIIFYYFLNAFLYFIREYDKSNLYNFFEIIDNKFFNKNAYIKIAAIIFLGCLPYLIIDYPAIIHADSGMMLGEYFNNVWENHNPIIQTYIFGKIVDLGGVLFGNKSAGVFLYVLIQTIYSCMIFALGIYYLKKEKYPPFLWIMLTAFITFLPIFPRHITTICKDHNYSVFVFLMLYIMILITNNKEDFKKIKFILPFWLITIILIFFTRKNGIHLVVLTLPFILIYLRKYKKTFISVFGITCLGIVIYLGSQYAIKNVYKITDDDTRETYSMLFQQTARYVKFFGDDVSNEEKYIINKVLSYDDLAEIYNPEISDPVKNTYRNECTKEQFRDYIGVWFKEFFKHPGCYLESFFNMSCSYFYPTDIGYYQDMYIVSNGTAPVSGYVKIYFPELMEKFRIRDMNSRNVPLIGLFSSIGFYTLIDFIILLYFILYKKDKKYILYMVPAIISLIICLLSPVNGTIRYALPIIFYAPFLLCMCFSKDEE